ncbi:MAG TPA: phosphoribosylformylglycinamidine synthase subunit PurS [Leptospiraceae bacterium]|nr:phosphoribosylformylglycinamidine synthase subunit PurS [Leptospiraceae bacterium]HMY66861.1 phosphoribosylformylglycinamidine synthase subunit PurS [Leptospiraceae bacterium]HMZ58116.1 phosphoribosylformylglycinamidine synthase subunit PurS [Leptospiraceae bacterium]HNF15383.1 phosphoribosylformylglycinamidine synthase subunit PurS [Leptospiraceae bacterium]HNF28532.1 phosphoribosylformylglycinamidine synthase subunit PurS [Leptospiraceae bacterium]
MFIGKVSITLKKSVLDPQGNAVMKALHDMGENTVADVRIGKYAEVRLSSDSKEKAEEELHRICRSLLVNEVIESYRVELEKI